MEVADKINIYKKGIGNQFVDPEFQDLMKAQIALLEKEPEAATFSVGDHVKYRAGDPEFWMYGVITSYDGDGLYRIDAYGIDPDNGAVHDEAKRNQKDKVQLKPLKDFMLYKMAKSAYEKEMEPYTKKYPASLPEGTKSISEENVVSTASDESYVDTSGLRPMQLGKIRNQLKEKYSVDGTEYTLSELIPYVVKKGSSQKPYNRKYFNSLDAKGQEEYELNLASNLIYYLTIWGDKEVWPPKDLWNRVVVGLSPKKKEGVPVIEERKVTKSEVDDFIDGLKRNNPSADLKNWTLEDYSDWFEQPMNSIEDKSWFNDFRNRVEDGWPDGPVVNRKNTPLGKFEQWQKENNGLPESEKVVIAPNLLASRLRLLEKMIAKDPENKILKTRVKLLRKRLDKND